MLEEKGLSTSMREPEVEPISPNIPNKMREQLSSNSRSGKTADVYQDYTIDRHNMVIMRARKPVYSNLYKSCTYNFEGRVTKASKKNCQVEYKSRIDDKCQIVFQHGSRGEDDKKGGKKNGKIYALDFCYPFSTL